MHMLLKFQKWSAWFSTHNAELLLNGANFHVTFQLSTTSAMQLRNMKSLKKIRGKNRAEENASSLYDLSVRWHWWESGVFFTVKNASFRN